MAGATGCMKKKGIVVKYVVMKDCSKDVMYALFEYTSISPPPLFFLNLNTSIALTMKAALKSSSKISNNVDDRIVAILNVLSF